MGTWSIVILRQGPPNSGRRCLCSPSSPASGSRRDSLAVRWRPSKSAGEFAMELVDPAVEPYFGGTFLNARPMPHKPDYVVAELACQPPEETIRELMKGEKIVATLRWRPPLTTLLPFRIGAVLALTGMAGWAVSLLGLARRRTTQLPQGPKRTGPLAACSHATG